MALRRRIRQIGNSIMLVIPNEIFDFLEYDPKVVRYKFCQDETGVFIIILDKNAMMIDEKNFVKRGNSYAVIIPKPLCVFWNVGLNEGQRRDIELSYDTSPLKWHVEPV